MVERTRGADRAPGNGGDRALFRGIGRQGWRATTAVFRAIWHPVPRVLSRAAVEEAAAAIDRMTEQAALVQSMRPEDLSTALMELSERLGQ